jgi:hypothetical protein
MSENTIVCPKCKAEFPLTESLVGSALAEERERSSVALATATAEAAKKAREEAQTVAERARLDAEVVANQRRLQLFGELQAAKDAAREAEAEARVKEEKLSEAQKAQAEAVRKTRELEDARRELDLTIERRVSESLGTVRAAAQKEALETERLRLAEREEMIASLRREIEALRQKAEQGSQQLQGEVQEVALEGLLCRLFPTDAVEPVAKGVSGADCLLRVRSTAAEIATILFESKRTKTWNGGWLPKLREDQRESKADIAVLVSQRLPEGVSLFDLIDGVWVCSVEAVGPLVAVLRAGLFAVHTVKRNAEGFETKAQQVYEYLVGQGFKHRLQGAVEALKVLQDGLEKEKRAIQRQWALRAAAHESAVAALVGLHGDVTGIAGASVPELENASLAALGPVEAAS